MMSSSKDEQKYTHNRVLFTESNGKPMFFFMKPCAERGAISEPVKYGGGIVSAKNNGQCIRLYPPDVRVVNTTGYSTKFVWDSIKANRLMDLEQYKMAEKCVEDSNDDEMNGNRQTYLTMTSRKPRGRMEFSLEDDMKMIKYIIEMRAFRYFKSVNLWKGMADAKLFSVERSWESLKGRFNKKILPRIASYNLTKEEVARFTNVQAAVADNDDKDEYEDDISVSSLSIRSVMRYTHVEDLQILNYILNKDLIREVKGNSMWRRMERTQVTAHSWQSMRERFLKRIVNNLSKYDIDFVSENNIKQYCGKKSCDESTPGSSVRQGERRSPQTDLASTSLTSAIIPKNTWVVNTFATREDTRNPGFKSSTKQNLSAGKTVLLSSKNTDFVKPKNPNSQTKLTSPSSTKTLPKSPQVRTGSSESEEDNFAPQRKKRKVKPLEDDDLNITPIVHTVTYKNVSLLPSSPQASLQSNLSLRKTDSAAKTVSPEIAANSNLNVSLRIQTQLSPSLTNINPENASPSRAAGNLVTDSPSVSSENPTNDRPSVPQINSENARPSRTTGNLASVGPNVPENPEDTNPSVSTQNISNVGPSGTTRNCANANPSVSPDKLVNAIPSVSTTSVVSLTPSSPIDRQSNSEAIMVINNLLNNDVTTTNEVTATDKAVDETIRDSSNLEPDSERNRQENIRPPPTEANFDCELGIVENSRQNASEEVVEHPNIPNGIRQLVIRILNGANDVTHDERLVLLEWVGYSLSMDSEQLSLFMDFLSLRTLPILRDINNRVNSD